MTYENAYRRRAESLRASGKSQRGTGRILGVDGTTILKWEKKGFNCPAIVLSSDDVARIISRWRTGTSLKVLAAEFGVSISAVWHRMHSCMTDDDRRARHLSCAARIERQGTEILSLWRDGLTYAAAGKRMGVSHSTAFKYVALFATPSDRIAHAENRRKSCKPGWMPKGPRSDWAEGLR